MGMKWFPQFAVGLALFLLAAPTVRSGDYGLTVDNSVADGCRFELSHTRNTCNAETVIQELRARFVQGNDHRISAVDVGLLHCSVWFEGDEEKQLVYREFARIVARPEVHFQDILMRDIGCFPFKSMKVALEQEMAAGGHTTAGIQRLETAHALIVEKYRD